MRFKIPEQYFDYSHANSFIAVMKSNIAYSDKCHRHEVAFAKTQ